MAVPITNKPLALPCPLPRAVLASTFFRLSRSLALLLVLSNTLIAQKLPTPTAAFDFNNHSAEELLSHRSATLSGVSYTKDRFGNANNAVYLYGNSSSFVNLGNDAGLKPKTGTISMWVNVAKGVWSGQGYHANPLLLTKRSSDDDFFEAYGIYYEYESGVIAACVAKDSLRQVNVTDLEPIDLNTWLHVIYTYDNDSIGLYINGKLIIKNAKGFETVFLKDSPVLLGVSDNAKNSRYAQASFDDISIYEGVLNANQVKELFEAPDPNKFAKIKRLAVYVLLILLLIALIIVWIRNRLQKQHEKERQAIELQKKLLETELRVNRALMNPHFVFNAMNAVQGLILKNENAQANDYLIKFSRLMRLILESNAASISLETEIDILKRYVEIEELRLDGKFECLIEVDDNLKPAALQIPIMLLQPFVENALWHGLLHKEGEKLLKLSFSTHNAGMITCVIDDNGIGRKNSEVQKPHKKSLAIQFIRQRLTLLNRLYELNCQLEIFDKANGEGTIVTITIPIINHLK